jgi:outer membrane protein assembly factor BamB
LSFADGHEVWQAETGGSDRQALSAETLLVGGEGSGRLSALDVGSGKERWRVETGAAPPASPVDRPART